MLIEKIQNRESGIVLYGIVPPKAGTAPERVQEIAALQAQRISPLPVDGLVVYDIFDETSRTAEKRPFPFMETLDGCEYSQTYLSELDMPRVIYRSAGKYSEAELTQFLQRAEQDELLTVFVGAASKNQSVSMTMPEAYALKNRVAPAVPLGGVTIPERHVSKGNEHLNVFNKIQQGCSFFVSQGVYDLTASKDLLSDYYYHAQDNNLPMVPIIFTLTPCGSPQTLRFMKWLGISIPRWLENDLRHATDILEKSVDVSEQNWLELKAYADEKGIPVGCNIESVAIRKLEVEASIELVQRIVK
ncbi:MAG: methylenetetrahydrofolate reductase [Oceanobacter sp.]